MNTTTKDATMTTTQAPDTRLGYAIHSLRKHAQRVGTDQTIPRFTSSDAAVLLRHLDALVAALRGMIDQHGNARVGQGGAYSTEDDAAMKAARAALKAAAEQS